MSKRHSPANDLFNELLDETINALLDVAESHFKRMTRDMANAAKQMANQQQAAEAKTRRKRTMGGQKSNTMPPPTFIRRHAPATLYDTLEVSPRASIETIEAAYKSLARRHHPDVGGSLTKMQDIINAYQVLKDRAARGKYDRSIGL